MRHMPRCWDSAGWQELNISNVNVKFSSSRSSSSSPSSPSSPSQSSSSPPTFSGSCSTYFKIFVPSSSEPLGVQLPTGLARRPCSCFFKPVCNWELSITPFLALTMQVGTTLGPSLHALTKGPRCGLVPPGTLDAKRKIVPWQITIFSDAILKPKHADKSTTKRFSWTLSSAVFADAPRMFMGGITTNWSINFPTKTFQAQTGESANGLTLYIKVAPTWKESKGNQ